MNVLKNKRDRKVSSTFLENKEKIAGFFESVSVMKRNFNGNVDGIADGYACPWRLANDYLEYFPDVDLDGTCDKLVVNDMPSIFLFHYFRSIKSYIHHLYSVNREGIESCKGEISSIYFVFSPDFVEALAEKEIIIDESVSLLNELDIFLRLIISLSLKHDFKFINLDILFNYNYPNDEVAELWPFPPASSNYWLVICVGCFRKTHASTSKCGHISVCETCYNRIVKCHKCGEDEL